MNVAADLTGAGWTRDPASGVWGRADHPPISYSDGDAGEEAVLSALRAAGDRSVGSDELRAAIGDWPTEYHLSPQRADLVRPVPVRPGDRVLELGAGCGAITRLLGESGAEVIAVEGSHRRAVAAALRCSDLRNVNVVCSDLLQFDAGGNFDWVFVIGVLEYCRLFAAGETPELDYLRRMRAHAAPDGCLVLAIENQLGLKYFAGCGEDHIGRIYYGVQDLYGPGEPVTFGRASLENALRTAGFAAQEFLFPMPDYKLPVAIVRETAARAGHLEVGDLFSHVYSRDYSGQRARSFSERLAWQAVGRNRLLPELANSFLVLASAGSSLPARRRPPPDIAAWCYSTNRRRQHRVETVFIEGNDGLRTEKRGVERTGSISAAADSGGPRFIRRAVAAPYRHGKLLSASVARALARHDAVEVVDALLLRWIDALLALAQRPSDPGTRDGPLLPGDHVDATPANAIVDADGKLAFIDLEWAADRPVPLAWLVLRGVLGISFTVDDAGAYAGQTALGIAERLLARRDIALQADDVALAIELDALLLREAVFGDAAKEYPLTRRFLESPIKARVDTAEAVLATLKVAARDGDTHRGEAERLGRDVTQLRALLDAERRVRAEDIANLQAATARLHQLGLEAADSRAAQERSARDLAALRDDLVAERALQVDIIAKLQRASARAHELDQELAAERALHADNIAKLQQASARAHQRDQELAAERALHADNIANLQQASALAHQRGLELAAERALHADNIAKLQRASAQAHRLGVELGHTRTVIDQQNAELVALHVERNNFAAKLGRRMSSAWDRWLPPESRRGRAGTLAAQFAQTVASAGLGGALRRSTHFVLKRLPRTIPSAARAALDDAPVDDRASPDEFARWIASHEPDAKALEQQRSVALQLPLRPQFSVILPVYRVSSQVLCATLDSLLAQTYDRWEACIAYADLDNADHWRLLEEYATRDARLRPLRLPTNAGISGNSNAALAQARGEFIALVDHDDTLSASALFAIAERLNAEPDLDFLYTDKDSIDAAGKLRQNALFKPEWSPEILHSVNYLTHLNVMRRSLVEAVGGWRTETDGAQDWDLFFRVCEQTRRIARVPGIHYHWRIIPSSVASGLHAKPYALLAQLRCQQDRLARCGLDAVAELNEDSGFRLRWSLPESPLADLVVRGPADARLLRGCLDTLRFASLGRIGLIHVLVPVDTPGIEAVTADFTLVWGERVRFDLTDDAAQATAVARIATRSAASLLVVVDGRAEAIAPDFATELCGWVHGHREIAWAAAIALRMDETVVEAGRIAGDAGRSAPLFRGMPLRSWGWFGGALWYRNAGAASPYAFALRRPDLAAIPPTPDEPFDTWWLRVCAALRAGDRRGLVDPHARVWFAHDPEPTPPPWHESFARDPCFHPYFQGVSPLRLLR